MLLDRNLMLFFSGVLGTFLLYLDIEYEPMVCYGAGVFHNKETKYFLYRSKYGNWVIGKDIL